MLEAEAGGLAEVAFGSESRITTGIAGIRRLAQALPGWGERDDARAIARFNASCIEKFGNGGGNFRRLYARFLDWARERDESLVPEDAAARARQAADGWTAMSRALAAGFEEGSGPEPWQEAAGYAAAIADCEEALFRGLLDRVA
jgi:hypothetical protein